VVVLSVLELKKKLLIEDNEKGMFLEDLGIGESGWEYGFGSNLFITRIGNLFLATGLKKVRAFWTF